MAFKCENCKEVQENGTKAMKVVTQIRKVVYPVVKDDRGLVVKTPTGHETVKELTVCPKCAVQTFHPIVVGKEKVLA